VNDTERPKTNYVQTPTHIIRRQSDWQRISKSSPPCSPLLSLASRSSWAPLHDRMISNGKVDSIDERCLRRQVPRLVLLLLHSHCLRISSSAFRCSSSSPLTARRSLPFLFSPLLCVLFCLMMTDRRVSLCRVFFWSHVEFHERMLANAF
jgi:hypothetical protein